MNRPVLHLLPNAHLDPVWLWDWCEGLNEGLATVATVLDLMDERPELTFMRGEAAIYRHIEENAPELFARIRTHIAAGRWDVVGGVWVQPDTNLSSTATLMRHFEVAGRYFESRFGKRPRIAWAADSFGHSAGLPEILANSHMEGFAFSRPFKNELELPGDAFWWQSASGQRVLAFRITEDYYGSERHTIAAKLDSNLRRMKQSEAGDYASFFGLGNHGGGPTRRHLDDIRAWQEAHPEVEVRFSTLHLFFEALQQNGVELPTFEGELNGCLRGCYSSAAKVKFAFRRAENAVSRADATVQAVLSAVDTPLPLENLEEAWEGVLFNSFHDILPGTSIERALEQQISWLGNSIHNAQKVEFAALNALAKRVDTSVADVVGDFPLPVSFLLWNPHSEPFSGQVELENCLDYRPIWDYQGHVGSIPLEVRGWDGSLIPFQRLETEHDFYSQLPWRSRVLVPVQIPPQGYTVCSLGWVEGAVSIVLESAVTVEESDEQYRISNGEFSVTTRLGAKGISIEQNGQPFLGGEGLNALTIEDPWGSWGDMAESAASLDLNEVRSHWHISHVHMLEHGPLRAKMWVRLQPDSGTSWLDLTFAVSHHRTTVDVSARVLWNERAARLKLVLPFPQETSPTRATFEVPGGTVTRSPNGEVPGGRWVGVEGAFGFASDALYNFDLQPTALRATVCRATRYATDRALKADEEMWRPALDVGELRFNFLLAPNDDQLPHLARELEAPVIVHPTPPGTGERPRQGSLDESLGWNGEVV